MSDTVVTKEEFRWILLEVFFQVFLYFVINMSNGRLRSSYFSNEFMKVNFQASFQEFGKNAPNLGVPDCGTGRFSDKLPYEKWISYNAAQYTANTGIHSIVGAVLITIGFGLYVPKLGIALGLFLIFWRILHVAVGRMKPSTLAILEPTNHFLHLSGLTAVAIIALYTAAN